MNCKTVAEMELFLSPFPYYVENDPIGTIGNLICTIIDTNLFKPENESFAQMPRTINPNHGLRMILSSDYKEKDRRLIKDSGFIHTDELLTFFNTHIASHKQNPFAIPTSCYEMCYTLKDVTNYVCLLHAIDRIRIRLVYTENKHLLLRFIFDNTELYDFDPNKNGCYFGPARIDEHTTSKIIEGSEADEYTSLFDAQILYFQHNYSRAKSILDKVRSSPFMLADKIIEKITARLDRGTRDEDFEYDP